MYVKHIKYVRQTEPNISVSCMVLSLQDGYYFTISPHKISPTNFPWLCMNAIGRCKYE